MYSILQGHWDSRTAFLLIVDIFGTKQVANLVPEYSGQFFKVGYEVSLKIFQNLFEEVIIH